MDVVDFLQTFQVSVQGLASQQVCRSKRERREGMRTGIAHDDYLCIDGVRIIVERRFTITIEDGIFRRRHGCCGEKRTRGMGTAMGGSEVVVRRGKRTRSRNGSEMVQEPLTDCLSTKASASRSTSQMGPEPGHVTSSFAPILPTPN